MRSTRAHGAAESRQLPYFPYWLSIATLMLTAFALGLAWAVGEELPDAAVIVAGVISAACLSMIRSGSSGEQGFMRTGFHVGVVAFFLLMPLLFPEQTTAELAIETREQVGLLLIVSVLGFEAGYWLTHAARTKRPPKELAGAGEGTPRPLVWLTLVGVLVWAAYELAFARAIGANVTDVLLAMRTPIEGADENMNFVWRYGPHVANALLFLAATAGCVTVGDHRVAPSLRLAGWSAIGCLTVVGFLTGSRGYFLLTAVPAAVACWFSITGLRRMPLMQPVAAVAAAAALLSIWFVMSAVRNLATIEDEFRGTDTFVQGAFDIYSPMAAVVETFPRIIDYQYGASAVPVVLGWVPRTLWPQKPYPFGLLMNLVAGEDLERRQASLATGLPAEGYGNFGMAGVLLWVLVMGAFCCAVDDYVRRVDLGHPLGLQLAGVSCVWAAMITRGGVAEMFYMGLEVMLAPLAIAFLMSKRSVRVRQRVSPPFRRPRLA